MAFALYVLAVSSTCMGAVGPVLVVHDGTGGLNASVLANLSAKLTTAGNTVTPNAGVPGGSLATYEQIWDIRFNNIVFSGPEIAAYITYLAGGGSLFVMGENTGFAVRNSSIVSLIASAGGGTITVAAPGSNTQTVQPPFTGPNAVGTVSFLAGAATTNPASGSFITSDGTSGIALVWGPGRLASAAAGTLIVVFDVNFLDASATAPLQAFSDNLIAYLAAPVPISSGSAYSVPTLSEWAMILLACGFMLVAIRRLSAAGRAAS